MACVILMLFGQTSLFWLLFLTGMTLQAAGFICLLMDMHLHIRFRCAVLGFKGLAGFKDILTDFLGDMAYISCYALLWLALV